MAFLFFGLNLQGDYIYIYIYILLILWYVNRLSGAALLAPIINYWWRGLPSNLSTEAYYKQLPQDQWTHRVSHYIPWLTYWWNTQKWFPALSAVPGNPNIFSRQDLEITSKKVGKQINKVLDVFFLIFQRLSIFISISLDLYNQEY